MLPRPRKCVGLGHGDALLRLTFGQNAAQHFADVALVAAPPITPIGKLADSSTSISIKRTS